jgi:hypothetical protein
MNPDEKKANERDVSVEPEKDFSFLPEGYRIMDSIADALSNRLGSLAWPDGIALSLTEHANIGAIRALEILWQHDKEIFDCLTRRMDFRICCSVSSLYAVVLSKGVSDSDEISQTPLALLLRDQIVEFSRDEHIKAVNALPALAHMAVKNPSDHYNALMACFEFFLANQAITKHLISSFSIVL